MSALSPPSGVKRKSDLRAVRSAFDPGSVKTRTRGECAEWFSLFSSFGGACQSGSFLIQRIRDKRSMRKFDVGVFTQPKPTTDICQPPIFRQRSRILSSGTNSPLGALPDVRFMSGLACSLPLNGQLAYRAFHGFRPNRPELDANCDHCCGRIFLRVGCAGPRRIFKNADAMPEMHDDRSINRPRVGNPQWRLSRIVGNQVA